MAKSSDRRRSGIGLGIGMFPVGLGVSSGLRARAARG